MATNWKLSAHLLRHTCLVSVRWHNLLHYGRRNRRERAAAFNRTRVCAAVPSSTGHTFMLCNISVADIKHRSSTHAGAHIETVSISWRTLARWKFVRREMHSIPPRWLLVPSNHSLNHTKLCFLWNEALGKRSEGRCLRALSSCMKRKSPAFPDYDHRFGMVMD